MAKKQVVRLTESDLHRIIKESVNNVLTELDWTTYSNAAAKRFQQAYNGNTNGRANSPEMAQRGNKLAQHSNEMFEKQYGVSIYDVSNPNWQNSHPGHPAIKAYREYMNNRKL